MLRKLLVGAFVVGVSFTLASFLCLAAGSPAWAQVERKNCPGDFHWERMSGQCCVQDYETIPEHGRIGYTGNSICDDGYAGIYERRPTTDGQGPPGCPGYTSFVFLKECRESDGGGAASGGSAPSGGGTISGGGAPGNRVEEAIRDASEALYSGGGGPSNKDLALAGGLMGGIGLLAGMGTFVLGGPPITQMPGAAPGADLQQLRDASGRLRDLFQRQDRAQREWKSWSDLHAWYRWQVMKHMIGPTLFVGGSLVAAVAAGGAQIAVYKLADSVGGIATIAGGVGGVMGTFKSPKDAWDIAVAANAKKEEAALKTQEAYRRWQDVNRQVEQQQQAVDDLRRRLGQTPPR